MQRTRKNRIKGLKNVPNEEIGLIERATIREETEKVVWESSKLDSEG